jgi:hypothetical protein
MRRRFSFALLTTLLSLVLLSGAVVAADFAAGAGALLALLAVPCTLGLPTTVAVLSMTALWPGGPPLWLFAVLCLLAGSALQYMAFALVARWRRRA